MDISGITDFIQTLGFPIACVCYMFYMEGQERKRHSEESKEWTDALHKNTIAITQLTDFIKERLKDDK